MSIDDIKTTLCNHINPVKYEVTERANFHNIKRNMQEPVQDFILRIQKQSSFCNFGDQLENQLRDKIVAGINEAEIQKKLLMEHQLTFQKAKEICLTFANVNQAIGNQQQVLWTTKSHKNFNKNVAKKSTIIAQVKNKDSKTDSAKVPSGNCFSCGGKHFRSECKYREATCQFCNNKGHIKKVCKKFLGNKKEYKRTLLITPNSQFTNQPETNDCTAEAYVLQINNNSGSHLNKQYWLDNGKSINLIQDTGSPYSFLPVRIFKEKFPNRHFQNAKVQLFGVTGHPISVLGKTNILLQEGQNIINTEFIIIKEGPCVIGLNALKQFGNSLTLNVSNTPPMKNDLEQLIKKAGSLQGGMKIPAVHLEISTDKEPKFCKARPIAYGLREVVQKNYRN